MKLLAGAGGSALAGSLADSRTSNYTFAMSAYQRGKIILKTIPSSQEQIPAIGMGTWLTFDAGNSDGKRKELREVLRVFREHGGKLIDSSPMYGSSERVVGDLVSDLNIREQLFLATKVWTHGANDGVVQMNSSIEKMRSGVMDLMQVHNLVDAKTHLQTLKAWKREGRVRYIGITHYMASAYPDLMLLIKEERPDFVQFNYSVRMREAEKRLLPFCKDNGVAVINNRPFDGGDLFNTIQGKRLPPWADEFAIKSWSQFFLKYIISHPAVTCAIPATSKPAHMLENISSAFGPLPDAASRQKMAEFYDQL